MREIVADILSKHVKLGKKKIVDLIEIPPSSYLGDYAFPCFSLAKIEKKNPVEIAKEISSKIKSDEFELVKSVGPYVNFFINRNHLAEKTLDSIRKAKDRYGSGKDSRTILIEFSQANTHKSFHVGHIRATSFGESLSRVLEFNGNKVIRANYQGDTGMHVAKWIWCYKKYHSKEELKREEPWIASIYVEAVKRLGENEKLQEEVDEINRNLEEGKDKELMSLWKKSRDYSLQAFEKIYKELNTRFDKYYFERDVEKRGKEIAQELVKKGIAEISEGAIIINFEKYNLGVWVLLRKDGTVLYSVKDLALAEKKFKDFKLEGAIATIGMAQFLHTSQIKKALELMKFSKAKDYNFLHFAEVRLPSGKMSSRTGDNILYSDFIKEITDYAKSEILKREKVKGKELEDRALAIAISAIKYSLLRQHSNSVIVFNKEEALNFEGNTGPYLLYSYARARSILRKAKYKKQKLSIRAITDDEKMIIAKLSNFPEIVRKAYVDLSPSTIANYAFQLSQKFNEFYHSNKVIGSDNESFRLAIVDSFSIVLKNALSLLGINVLKKM